jgi:hypothetical protein
VGEAEIGLVFFKKRGWDLFYAQDDLAGRQPFFQASPLPTEVLIGKNPLGRWLQPDIQAVCPDELSDMAWDQRGPAFPGFFIFSSDTDDIGHDGV